MAKLHLVTDKDDWKVACGRKGIVDRQATESGFMRQWSKDSRQCCALCAKKHFRK